LLPCPVLATVEAPWSLIPNDGGQALNCIRILKVRRVTGCVQASTQVVKYSRVRSKIGIAIDGLHVDFGKRVCCVKGGAAGSRRFIQPRPATNVTESRERECRKWIEPAML
jgi:hypothetical protein